MVKEYNEGLELVGRMGMAGVYRRDTQSSLYQEYTCRNATYRVYPGHNYMKKVVRPLPHFDEEPLGGFQELLKENTKDLQGVNVIMKPTASLNANREPRGGQLVIVGWTYDLTKTEIMFFDGLEAK